MQEISAGADMRPTALVVRCRELRQQGKVTYYLRKMSLNRDFRPNGRADDENSHASYLRRNMITCRCLQNRTLLGCITADLEFADGK